MIRMSKIIMYIEYLIQVFILKNDIFTFIDSLIVNVFFISFDVYRKQSLFLIDIS